MKKFKFKKGDVEVRSTGTHPIDEAEHTTAEIVKWNGDSCYTLAYWIRGSEGFDLKFVGDRPFDVKPKIFMKLAKKADKLLHKMFRKQQNENI